MTAQARPLGTAGKILSVNDLHLVAKIIDHVDDEAMKDLGFTEDERVRAGHLYEALDVHVEAYFGPFWNETEVL